MLYQHGYMELNRYLMVSGNLKKSIFILLFALCSCKAGSDSSTQKELNSSSKECIGIEQKQFLNKAVELFETKIHKQHPELTKEAAYFEFISDWSNKRLNKNFFKDSLGTKVRNLNIWAESVRSDLDMDLEMKLFNVDTMNPVRVKLNIEFSTCLSRKTDLRKGVSSFLRSNSKYRISPKIAQKQLYRISEYDLKQFEYRLAIVLGVYYQTMFNINMP